MLGFPYHALVQHADLARPPRHLVFLQNYPACWVETFARQGLHRHDPVQLLASRRPGSFAWRDMPRLLQLTAANRQVMNDALRAGLGEGFTVPLHVPGVRSASCSFAVHPGEPLPVDSLLAAEILAHGIFSALFDILLAPRRRAIAHLAPRELECIRLMAQGKTDWEIGTILGLAEETVKTYLKSARERFGVARRTQLALAAVSHGHVSLDELVTWQ
ncbi:hypothetical protein LK12_22240 [Novosphingobium malaysiense]|uniref:HTH luxR-type domain-containing protein n=1 Tax=Novosphingobium malaysiense TaxID=1348853 RepID=A0A0B1ZIZ5_9SPHN|nr:hypothetical protein LK12_22240 [Novosphingobium malaysiense]